MNLWRLRTLVLLALALLGACRSTRTAARARDPFFFVVMADPQFGFFTANQDFVRETVNFERAIAAVNRLRPAFVVVAGDLIHRAGDAAQIAEYRRIAGMLDRSITLYNVAGNHDLALPLTDSSVRAYRTMFGADRYTFDNHGIHGIVLNSSLIKDPAAAPVEAAAHEAWLRSEIETARRATHERIMVFQHHSWFLVRADEPDQYFNLPLPARTQFLTLLKSIGVEHVFAGHYHRNSLGRDGPLEMVTTGPVGRPLGNDPSGFRIVLVTRDSVAHRYYALDSLPARVVLPR
jgi:serine/threonine-protein phosphatase CPPED1